MNDDISNQRFGRLVAIHQTGKNKYGQQLWLCRCDCGGEKEVAVKHLRRGVVASCGCLQRENRHRRAKDLRGKRFGRLIAIEPTELRVNKNIVWKCKCDCGKLTYVTQYKLVIGETKSCGCLRVDTQLKTHLKWKTPEERALSSCYDNMIQRCTNPKSSGYRFYGAKHIDVCKSWRTSKDAFVKWGLATGFKLGLTIDRIDTIGPYAPWNCRWVTMQEQCENRTSNVFVTVNGVTKTITAWSREIGCSHTTITNKLCKGYREAVNFIGSRLKTKKETTNE